MRYIVVLSSFVGCAVEYDYTRTGPGVTVDVSELGDQEVSGG